MLSKCITCAGARAVFNWPIAAGPASVEEPETIEAETQPDEEMTLDASAEDEGEAESGLGVPEGAADEFPDMASPEESAAEVRKKRSLLQLLALVVGGVVGGLLVLLVIALISGRMYIVSDGGRDLVTGFVQGQKISRYGRINVYGLKGDLFDDFTLDRVTVTDRDGVWLDARNVRVDWSYWPLITRRFHATDISAEVIQLVRRPVLDAPSGEPGGPQPIDVDIDRFSARVELLEGFSKEYGRWNLTGDIALPRRGAKTATVNADSLNRPGDYLRLAATFGGAGA